MENDFALTWREGALLNDGQLGWLNVDLRVI